jgi:hypothetical protein
MNRSMWFYVAGGVVGQVVFQMHQQGASPFVTVAICGVAAFFASIISISLEKRAEA